MLAVICRVLHTPLTDALELEGADEILHWFDQASWILDQERPGKGKG